MDQIETIANLERRATDAGLSIAEMCRRAEIAPMTWRRWRKGESGAGYTRLARVEQVVTLAESAKRQAPSEAAE